MSKKRRATLTYADDLPPVGSWERLGLIRDLLQAGIGERLSATAEVGFRGKTYRLDVPEEAEALAEAAGLWGALESTLGVMCDRLIHGPEGRQSAGPVPGGIRAISFGRERARSER